MAYVAVDADDRLEECPEGLQFKSFLGGAEQNNSQTQGGASGVGNADRGYLQDRPKGASGFWTLDYYQQYFDVDTKTVLRRCYATMIPTNVDFLSVHLNPPDLYGPFWTLTTLIFALYLSSSLGASIASYLSDPDEAYDYDFTLLSIAMSLVYAYGLAVPACLWLGLRYLGVGEWSIVEAIAVWGYSQFIWIPVSILCVIPVPLVRWVLVAVAFVLSGIFLIRNVYPILASAEAKSLRLVVVAIFILHAALALTFKVMFFSYYVVDKIGYDIPVPGGDDPGP
ncbi:hypothetical protein EV121DRAFT_256084 [Schizophyllum commune]